MVGQPQPVSMGILEVDNRYLLVEKTADSWDFPGMVGFPAGDVAPGQDPETAVVEAVDDLTHVVTDTVANLGTIDRIVRREDGEREFLLHVYELQLVNDSRPLTQWAFWEDEADLEGLEMIPGNLSIYRYLYRKEAYGRYRSVIEKRGGDYVQTVFRQI
ncbi:MAG: hypothetical protein SVU32_07905 [Candidatus Nanohaloarchaea archaeon]|nr:hypothetical protein [Candidatus Nanohaloarchaea archaeon]